LGAALAHRSFIGIEKTVEAEFSDWLAAAEGRQPIIQLYSPPFLGTIPLDKMSDHWGLSLDIVFSNGLGGGGIEC